MPGMAAKVIITERQQEVLQVLVWSRSCPQGLAHRAEIVLLAFEGSKNEVIAARLGCERHGVGIWRRRWQKAFKRLVVIECVDSGRPVTHWTPRELADEVIKRGIVPSISARHVGRFFTLCVSMRRPGFRPWSGPPQQLYGL